MTKMKPMIDDEGDWIDDENDSEDEELDSISRILKDTFGENFEKASIKMKLYLLEAVSASVRLDREWNQIMDRLGLDEEPEMEDLEFPEFFEDTQEAMKLIQTLTAAIAQDMTFHDLAIGGLC